MTISSLEAQLEAPTRSLMAPGPRTANASLSRTFRQQSDSLLNDTPLLVCILFMTKGGLCVASFHNRILLFLFVFKTDSEFVH